MIRAPVPGAPSVVLFGVVRGLLSEARALPAALDTLQPAVVGLGVSVEEARGLTDHFVGHSTEPLVPLLGSEAVEIRELGRFGEVRVPNPSFLAALEWAAARGVRAEAVDPAEEQYAEMFGSTVGYLELVRRTLRERRLRESPPRVDDPDQFVLQWDASLNRGRESQRLEARREQLVARELGRIALQGAPVAVVLDRERVPRLLNAFTAPGRGA